MSANGAWALSNYRLGLVKALIGAGYEVHAAVPPGPGAKDLMQAGVIIHDLPMQSRGTSPFADSRLLLRYVRLMRMVRPAAFLGFTIKPNIYGSIAARIVKARSINNITGLGTLFVTRSAVTRLVMSLYRFALAKSHAVFFQNSDDAKFFLGASIVSSAQVRRLPGSGIDLDRFRPVPKKRTGPISFLFAGRLLWEKGVREFVDAAEIVQRTNRQARFRILGLIEAPGKAAVGHSDLERWVAAGLIDFLGSADDVRPAMAAADCVVLPSYYREGVPRALLEAAAMGLPVITTDMAGSRDAVDDGRSGFLVRPRSAPCLADAMQRFIAMDARGCRAMGKAGRTKMQQEFNETIVHGAYLQALSE